MFSGPAPRPEPSGEALAPSDQVTIRACCERALTRIKGHRLGATGGESSRQGRTNEAGPKHTRLGPHPGQSLASLLRPALIEIFVKQRITDPKQWYTQVPQFLRQGTNGAEKEALPRRYLRPARATVARPARRHPSACHREPARSETWVERALPTTGAGSPSIGFYMILRIASSASNAGLTLDCFIFASYRWVPTLKSCYGRGLSRVKTIMWRISVMIQYLRGTQCCARSLARGHAVAVIHLPLCSMGQSP